MRYVRSYTVELAEAESLAYGTSRRRSRSSRAGATESSRWSTPSSLAERLPHSTLTMVDAGHFVWEEVPGEYASIVTAWIQRRSP